MAHKLLYLLLFVSSLSYAQVGIGTTTPKAFFNVAARKTVLFGEDTTGTGHQFKLIWYAGKGAFRAGFIDVDYWNRASVGFFSWAGGFNTLASGNSSVALGSGTRAEGDYTMATGDRTSASGKYAQAMGNLTVASGLASLAIGTQTTANGYAALAMGEYSVASGYASIATGYNTTSSGDFSTAMGRYSYASGGASLATGQQAVASGALSTAMGYHTHADASQTTAMGSTVSTNGHDGSFIIGDKTNEIYNSSSDNQLMMRFSGGYMLYSSSPPSQTTAVGVQLVPNGNAWQTLSDSTRKENFRPANGSGFLKKIGQMRLGSWNYKGQDAKQYRHYGPMAQDFFAAFGRDELGTIGEDKSINQADFDGVNLIAIQALIQKVEKLEAELAASKERESTTQARLSKIEALLSPSSAPTTVTFKP